MYKFKRETDRDNIIIKSMFQLLHNNYYIQYTLIWSKKLLNYFQIDKIRKYQRSLGIKQQTINNYDKVVGGKVWTLPVCTTKFFEAKE